MKSKKNRTILVALLIGCTVVSVHFLTDAHSIEKGSIAPDFTARTVDGNELTLSSVAGGKKVVLIFWASWCPHCRKEAPRVEQFYQKNKDAIAVIGVNVREDKETAAAFVKKENLSYPVVLDPDNTIARSYGVQGIPAIVSLANDRTVEYYGYSIDEAQQAVVK